MGKRKGSSSSSSDENQEEKRDFRSKNLLLSKGPMNSAIQQILMKKLNAPSRKQTNTSSSDESNKPSTSKLNRSKSDCYESSKSDIEDDHDSKYHKLNGLQEKKVRTKLSRKPTEEALTTDEDSKFPTAVKMEPKMEESSSEESSDSEPQMPMPICSHVTIKKEKISSPEESSSNEEITKPVPVKTLKEETSEDSESDSVDSEQEQKLKKSLFSKANIRNASRSSESDSVSENETRKNVSVMNVPYIKTEIRSSEYSGLEEEITPKRNKINKHKNSRNDNEDTDILKKNPIPKNSGNLKREIPDDSNFENEDEDMMEKIEKSIKKSQKKKAKIIQDIILSPAKIKNVKERLEEVFSDLREINTDTLNINVSDTDDIHLFRVPRNVDPHILKNIEIDLESGCKLNLGEKYNISRTTQVPDPTLVIANNCKILPFKSNINMIKYTKSRKEPRILIPERKVMPMPEKLKKRHPLFGTHFEPKINLSKEVEEKLDKAIAKYMKASKKSSKQKDKKIQRENVEEENQREEMIFNLLSAHSSKKVKKETDDDSAIYSSSSMGIVKKKEDRKKDKEIFGSIKPEPLTEYETDCQSSGVKMKKNKNHIRYGDKAEKINKIKREVFTEYETDCNSSVTKKKKKGKTVLEQDLKLLESSLKLKKKESKRDVEESLENQLSEESALKKEKKRLSIINSTLKEEVLKSPRFLNELSSIISDYSTKKLKKFKREPETEGKETIKLENNVTSEVVRSLHGEKTKKKKKHKSTEFS